MARGKSGRVVLEIDPELKRQLYATLAEMEHTMKDWFIKEAEDLIYRHKQPSLFNSRDNQSKRKRQNKDEA